MSDESGDVAMMGNRWVEAMDWLARFQEAGARELSGSEARAWQDWIADDDNGRIFDRCSRLSANRTRLALPGWPSPEALRNDTYDPETALVLPVPERPPRPRAIPPGRRMAKRNVLAIAAGVLLLLIGLLGGWIGSSILSHVRHPILRSHQTASGQIRHIDLEDGSWVILGAKSHLEVRYTPDRRAVSLANGEAWFHVAKSAERPFVVEAGRGTITALGTAFVVERYSDRVLVSVTDGTVAVSEQTPLTQPTSKLGGARVASIARVERGQRLSYDDAGTVSRVEHADDEAATSWSEGRLEFQQQPLKYVVEVVNRYSHRKIALDHFAGDQIFSGLVLQSQIDAWIHALPHAYPIDLIENEDRVCLRSRTAVSARLDGDCASTN